jgi:RecB family exonuclease
MRTKNGRPQLHFSGLDKLWECGEKFRRIYLEMDSLPKGTYIAVGSGVDTAVNRNLEQYILDQTLLSVEEVEDIARSAADFELKNNDIVYDVDEKELGIEKANAEAIEKAARLAVLHAKEIAPHLHPTAVQRKWSIEIPGIPFDLVGTIDVQEGSHSIRDTKTSGKSPAEGIADRSEQLSIYALAVRTLDGRVPDQVALDYLIDNKKPVAKTYTSTRDDDDFQVALARVENAADVIQKGSFTPARPTDWQCSLKWCGFFRSCKYAKRPKSVAIPHGGFNENVSQ